jgi:hypothetical protein
MMNTSSDEIESIETRNLTRGIRLQRSAAARKHRKQVKEVLALKTEKEDRLIKSKLENESL